jgi:hypothetical protein
MEIDETKKRPEAVLHRLLVHIRVEGSILWFVRVLKKLHVESVYIFGKFSGELHLKNSMMDNCLRS